MKTLLLTLALIVLHSTAQAGGYYSPYYGYHSTQKSPQGSFHSGVTPDGDYWYMRQNRGGNYHGMDAGGNFFMGDHKSGNYYNFGTGRTCIGTGYARHCY